MRDVAKKNLRALGFDKQIDKVEKGQCPFCGTDKVKPEDFRDKWLICLHSLYTLFRLIPNRICPY